MFVDYYKIARVHPESEPIVIAKMRKIFASLYHPDKAPESEKASLTSKLQEINAAIDFLMDPVKREAYDATHPYFAGSTEEEQTSENARGERSGRESSAVYRYADEYPRDIRENLTAEWFFRAAKTAKRRNLFTSFERKQFYNFAKRIKNNEELTDWQRKSISKYVGMAKKAGII